MTRAHFLGSVAVFLALLSPLPVPATTCALDPTPAATLLLPYFEVDLANPTSGVTTLFAVTNALPTDTLAKVTLWTDLSVATYSFNIHLTGFDVMTFNLRDLFLNGTVPGSQGTPPASCAGAIPVPPLTAAEITSLQNAHSGQPASQFGGLCGGANLGASVARGYVTIDALNFCTSAVPSNCGSGGYFGAGGTGAASNSNQLLGDYFYVNIGQAFAQGNPMVHIEADDTLGASNYTFYRRYCPGGEDQREGLISQFGTRYLSGGVFSGGTELIVWRDSKRTIAPFNCSFLPAPFPLTSSVTAFDEQENQVVLSGNPFPFETQRVQVGNLGLATPFNFGWLRLSMDAAVVGSQVPFEPLTQNWMVAVMSANNVFSVGFDAFQLDNVTFPGAACP
ncbi:MAG TPA: hypothetical protein VF017_17745 [Thermoanaerobaculia bacterium]|nr:hypothetical protein [Thermoanaerobaculia bacterium]